VSLNHSKELNWMRRLLILLAALALAAPPTAFALLGATKLSGTTGPGFTITLKKAGKAVKTLRPGSYTITVSDKSSSHDFVLTGPGVNKRITGVAFKGTKTATVRLKKGKYTYFCTPHKSFMKGSFTVR
jgi:Copper binding proteins, plastocyanin/azurin family